MDPWWSWNQILCPFPDPRLKNRWYSLSQYSVQTNRDTVPNHEKINTVEMNLCISFPFSVWYVISEVTEFNITTLRRLRVCPSTQRDNVNDCRLSPAWPSLGIWDRNPFSFVLCNTLSIQQTQLYKGNSWYKWTAVKQKQSLRVSPCILIKTKLAMTAIGCLHMTWSVKPDAQFPPRWLY